jgi:hypothetical protein
MTMNELFHYKMRDDRKLTDMMVVIPQYESSRKMLRTQDIRLNPHFNKSRVLHDPSMYI